MSLDIPDSDGQEFHDVLPWDVYVTSFSNVSVLEGSWGFNQRMRVVLNGTTTKNGISLEGQTEIVGIVRAWWNSPNRHGYWLRSEDPSVRSAEISFR